WRGWPMTFSRNPKSFTHGRAFALPSEPKVGAVCLNWACTDLRGGRGAILVPTAILLLQPERSFAASRLFCRRSGFALLLRSHRVRRLRVSHASPGGVASTL